ncbi:MAG: alpha/beta fold hydrolase [Atopobiaceae bacterium]|nr:alpha/beta fold hydrolase [Atopobiaceae bacterium]
MDTNIKTETVFFPSTDGTTQVRGVIWWPNNTREQRGVVQLVHGMAEHIMRYADFARFLADKGFVVCGHDHVGHGESVKSPELLGCLPLKGGRDVLVGDVGLMRKLIRERVNATLPHFLFGHSMGSFVVRAYIAESGQGLAGAIICGTGHVPPALSASGNLLAQAISRIRDERYVSKLLGDLSIGAYSKAIENARTPLDWLSYSKENVDAYIADKKCGFAFSAGANAALMALTREVCTPKCCARVPHKLPLFYISGDGDPVGNMGEGVRTAATMAKEAGSTDVTCTIFEHMRHEILNEVDHQRVYDAVLQWLESHLSRPTTTQAQ